jgi:hypothetical protein
LETDQLGGISSSTTFSAPRAIIGTKISTNRQKARYHIVKSEELVKPIATASVTRSPTRSHRQSSFSDQPCCCQRSDKSVECMLKRTYTHVDILSENVRTASLGWLLGSRCLAGMRYAIRFRLHWHAAQIHWEEVVRGFDTWSLDV